MIVQKKLAVVRLTIAANVLTGNFLIKGRETKGMFQWLSSSPEVI